MLPDFGWTELLVVAIVLIVVVGPKDLPKMLRTFGKTTSSLRRMAGDFRKQFDDALKEAEMEDVRDIAKDLRKLDPRNEIKDAFKPVSKAGREINDDLRKATSDLDKPEKKKSAAEAALDSSGDRARQAKAATAMTGDDKPAMSEQSPPAASAKANGQDKPIGTAGKKAQQKKPTPARNAPSIASPETAAAKPKAAAAKKSASRASGKKSASTRSAKSTPAEDKS